MKPFHLYIFLPLLLTAASVLLQRLCLASTMIAGARAYSSVYLIIVNHVCKIWRRTYSSTCPF
jgi:hypothetical protein